MSHKIIKKTLSQYARKALPIFAVFIVCFSVSNQALAENGLLKGRLAQSFMTLSDLVSHTLIDSLLFFDGEKRSEEGLLESISGADAVLNQLSVYDDESNQTLALVNAQWSEIKKHINDMPDDPGYSYFYLERISSSINALKSTLDDYVLSVEKELPASDYELYSANSDVLKVVSMHLSAAIMDVGNDAASKARLVKHCDMADKNILAVISHNPVVKSYVLRSWKYIEGPICKTGKKGGNYTISHFAKKISKKLNGLYSAPNSVVTGNF